MPVPPLTPDPERIAAELGELLLDRILPRIEQAVAESGRAGLPAPLLSVDDVAAYLNVSRRTVDTLVAEGELVPLRVRGARRFTQAQVDAYLRRCATGGSLR